MYNPLSPASYHNHYFSSSSSFLFNTIKFDFWASTSTMIIIIIIDNTGL